MENKLKLAGRSGCEIGLIYKGKLPVVRKYSKSISYNERLLRQGVKQQQFAESVLRSIFHTPRILASGNGSSSELSWLEMEYVHAEKYSDFLERISVPQLESLASSFSEYFDRSIASSQKQRVNPEVFTGKLSSVAKDIDPSKGFDTLLLKRVFSFLDTVPTEELYIGTCHGDFTFSNMLFDDQRLYLIDFLDTFIETPLQDIAKYRQDTRYFWSLMLEGDLPLYQKNKLVQVLRYLDRVGENLIKEDKIVAAWYQYFQVFNLLRILPYLEHAHEIKFVEAALEQTL